MSDELKDFTKLRAMGVRNITVTTVKPMTPVEFHRVMSEIADGVLPSAHRPFQARIAQPPRDKPK